MCIGVRISHTIFVSYKIDFVHSTAYTILFLSRRSPTLSLSFWFPFHRFINHSLLQSNNKEKSLAFYSPRFSLANLPFLTLTRTNWTWFISLYLYVLCIGAAMFSGEFTDVPSCEENFFVRLFRKNIYLKNLWPQRQHNTISNITQRKKRKKITITFRPEGTRFRNRLTIQLSYYFPCSSIAYTLHRMHDIQTHTSLCACTEWGNWCIVSVSDFRTLFHFQKSTNLLFLFSLPLFHSLFPLFLFQDTEQIERFSPALVYSHWQQPASTCGNFLHNNYKVGGKSNQILQPFQQ